MGSRSILSLLGVVACAGLLALLWKQETGSTPGPSMAPQPGATGASSAVRQDPVSVEDTAPLEGPSSSSPGSPVSRNRSEVGPAVEFTSDSAAREAAAQAVARVHGQVVDWNGDPLAGVELNVGPRRQGQVVWTLVSSEPPVSDARGRFDFRLGTQEGQLGDDVEVSIRATHDAYASAVESAPAGTELRIVLVPLPVLEGFVVTHEGLAPIEPAKVSVRMGIASKLYSTLTADDGSWRLERLPVEPLMDIRASALGAGAVTLNLDRRLAAGTVERIDIQLRPAVTVRGRVTEAVTGIPIPGALVWCGQFDPKPGRTTGHSDDEGHYELHDVGPGLDRDEEGNPLAIFEIYARADGYGTPRAVRYVASVRTDNAYEIDLQLTSRSSSLRGRVFEPSGKPAVGVWVLVIDSDGEQYRTGTGKTGAYQFDELARGEAYLMAFQDSEQNGYARAEERPVLVGAAWEQDLVLAPTASGRIEGRVVRQGTGSVEGLPVAADCLARHANTLGALDVHRSSSVRADGTFTIEGCLPGAANVYVEETYRWPSALLQDAAGQMAVPSSLVVDIPAGGASEPVIFRIEEAFSAGGRVVSSGTELASVRIELRDRSTGELIATAVPRADGDFRVGPVARGLFVLELLVAEQSVVSIDVGPGRVDDLLLSVPQ